MISDLSHDGGRFVTARCMEIPLESFLFYLPKRPPVTRERASSAQQRDAHMERMWDLYPWLRDVGSKLQVPAASAPSSHADVVVEDESESHVEMSEHEVELGMRALEDARSALQAVVISSDDFKTRVVGRSSLLEQKGNALQAIVGEQATPKAREFCQRRHVQQSVSFSPEKFGGPDACGLLARAWCHKMQYFLNQEQLHAAGTFEIDAAALAQYCEPTDFAQLADIGGQQVRRRAQQIRNIFQ